MTAETILHRLYRNGRMRPNAPAYYEKIGNAWVPTSWFEFMSQVRQAAKALINLGFDPGSGVSILGFNRPEWTIFDLAGMLAGGHATGIYTTNSPEEVKYIINHSEARYVLLEDQGQWEKVNQVRDDLPHLKRVIMMKGTQIDDPLVLTWEAFLAEGDDVDEAEVDARLDALELDQLATLIYTSGTTGPPKGVMLSHRNLTWTAQQGIDLFNITANDRVLSYLPLSHIAEQMFTIHTAVTAAYQLYYAQYPPQNHLADNLKEVQPTLVFGVPRVWERFHDGVRAKLGQATGAKAKIADWAIKVGAEAANYRNQSKPLPTLLNIQHNLAERLVFSTVKEGLGLTQAHTLVTSAAPIQPEIVTFFNSVNMPLFELYGQSEDCGPTSTNRHGANKIASVGQAWPGTTVKLADDNEILVKGDNVFMGYYKDPAATNETLIDGWLYSGDLGQFDEDGYLTIIGRKKEIIITSGGKNIAPKNIESALKNIPIISQAVVIGEQRRFLTALLTLNEELAQDFAQKLGIKREELHNHPELQAMIQKEIEDKVNPHFARVETVRSFRVLPHDFGVETGEMTPTMKIKRRVINEKYANEIESMYEG